MTFFILVMSVLMILANSSGELPTTSTPNARKFSLTSSSCKSLRDYSCSKVGCTANATGYQAYRLGRIILAVKPLHAQNQKCDWPMQQNTLEYGRVTWRLICEILSGFHVSAAETRNLKVAIRV